MCPRQASFAIHSLRTNRYFLCSILTFICSFRKLHGIDCFSISSTAKGDRSIARVDQPVIQPRVSKLLATHTCSPASSLEIPQTMRSISGLREIVNDYDVFLLDMWGVLHDGIVPYEGVLHAVEQLRKYDKQLVVLSNSSKPRESSRRSLNRLGFDPDASFDAIITSGEVCYNLLSSEEESACPNEWWSELRSIASNNKKALVLGSGEDDIEYCRDCGWEIAESVEEASMILARGTGTILLGGGVDRTAEENRYEELLSSILNNAAARKLPMLVANPDKIRPDAGRSPMPGAIGERYRSMPGEDADGLIERIGKPFPEVYRRALSSYKSSSSKCVPPRVCMVGDALETDVVGGAVAGIDTLWVLDDGVFAGSKLTPQDILDDFNEQKDITYARGRIVAPNMCIPHFRW